MAERAYAFWLSIAALLGLAFTAAILGGLLWAVVELALWIGRQ